MASTGTAQRYDDPPAETTRPRLGIVRVGLPARPRTPGYSRFVVLMKFVLPAIALALIAAVVVWPYVEPRDDRFNIGFAALEGVGPEEPSALNARLVGTDTRDRPYTITADVVRNAVPDAEELEIELELPKADITLEDGSWVVLTADAGTLRRETSALELTGAVNLFHDAGYEFHTTRMTANLEARTAQGDAPISGQGPFGTLEASGFRLDDDGRTVFFSGPATLRLNAGSAGGAR